MGQAIEVATTLRGLRRAVPVVLTAARLTAEAKRAARRLGAFCCLRVPATAEILLATIGLMSVVQGQDS